MTERIRRIPSRTAALAAVPALIAAVVSGCGSSGGTSSTVAATGSAPTLAPIHGKYSPTIDPANFVSTIDNRYWPLKPGTGYHYKGVRGTTPQRDDEIVTHQTKRSSGSRATVVRDTVSEHGNPVERTLDYYAQDKQGNVWYMGEDSFEKQHGRMVRASDSWLSGVKGGEPGIIMPGNPQPGDKYRQEYYPPGKALDEAPSSGRMEGSRSHPAPTSSPGDQRIQPAGAADGAEVLRGRAGRGRGAGGQGAPRGVPARQRDALSRCGCAAPLARRSSLPYTSRTMYTLLGVVQVIISVVLIFLVLLHSGKDTGLSGAFGIGQSGSSFGGGSLVERNLDRWTVFFAILFVLNTIVLLKI